ncbi:MAG: molybdopterin-synthase adenylyltransferase MoeB [Candidatus Hadarchaeota archaeon]
MTKVKVQFSVIFKDITGEEKKEIDLSGKTIRDLLEELIDRYGPEFKERIIDPETGQSRQFINIFKNGNNIKTISGIETKIEKGDEIRLIPSVAGGKDEFGFTEDQIVRYSRQIVLPQVGGKGQKKLRDGKILVVGAGGLGSPALLYLASAGIGKIGIVDDDKVELSNLQRQIIHKEDSLGKPKVKSAEKSINEINSEVNVVTYNQRINSENAHDIVKNWDFVIDGSDNFPTKFLINDVCVLEEIPFSHGGILRFTGMATTILPGEGPCYRCFTPEAPPTDAVPSCQEAGVLGVLPGIIGSIQANEAMKYLLEVGELLTNRMLYLDSLELRFEQFEYSNNPKCPICGKNSKINDVSNVEYDETCEVRF